MRWCFIDVSSLKNYIITKPELIELILEKSGFHDIDDNFSGGIEYRCARDEGKNPTAVRVNKDTLQAQCFSTNLKGDLITLVQNKLNKSFPKTIEFIAKVINFEDVNEKEYQLPFRGFYKKIKRFKETNYEELETYDERLLNQYQLIPNIMFYQDGINEYTQYKYQIGYDNVSDRIVVPWRSMSGELIGLMGRKNKREVEEGENKWFPILKFPKSLSLFGFSHNYNFIQEKGIVIITESEKGTMQLSSMGLGCGVSLGGSSLSEYQANNIKSLFPNKIILALDEGLNKDIPHQMAEQLKITKYFKNNVGYIHDKNGLYLPTGSKMSPTDLPKEDFKALLKNHVTWV